MTALDAGVAVRSETDQIAARFVAARKSARGTADYPGREPQSMAEAYAIQEAAISLWPDTIAGWKVGMVPPAQQARLGARRLAGPIFADHVQYAKPAATVLPVIEDGFAAVEGEFVARIGRDAPTGKTDWTLEEAADQMDAMFIGVELAGSPLSTINALGSAVVASDFGNNAGLVVGPELTDWRERLAGVTVTTTIDGVVVGQGTAASIPAGVLESVRFLLGHCAGRGRPLRAGTLVSTGAVTGVHQIKAGQAAVCAFTGVGEIACTTVKAGGQ